MSDMTTTPFVTCHSALEERRAAYRRDQEDMTIRGREETLQGVNKFLKEDFPDELYDELQPTPYYDAEFGLWIQINLDGTDAWKLQVEFDGTGFHQYRLHGPYGFNKRVIISRTYMDSFYCALDAYARHRDAPQSEPRPHTISVAEIARVGDSVMISFGPEDWVEGTIREWQEDWVALERLDGKPCLVNTHLIKTIIPVNHEGRRS